jgi:hypothetical protein
VPKDGCLAVELGSSQGQIGPRSVYLANGKEKLNAERKSEEVATEQDRVLDAMAETKVETGTSSQWAPNRTI